MESRNCLRARDAGTGVGRSNVGVWGVIPEMFAAPASMGGVGGGRGFDTHSGTHTV